MVTIHKYRLEIANQQRVTMRKGAKVLCVHNNPSGPCIWALVDTDEPMEKRTFFILETGKPCVWNADTYVGTFDMLGGRIVYHVFDLGTLAL